MSLAIAFKGPEGIVLAADSRVTIKGETESGPFVATYDNATKLLRFPSQRRFGAATYGLGAFGTPQPRTVHGYLSEFSEKYPSELPTVEAFAAAIGEFFLARWQETMPPGPSEDIIFFAAGYNDDEPYGSVYEVRVPSHPIPIEKNPGQLFGVSWGGMHEFTSRLLNGLDPRTLPLITDFLRLDAGQAARLAQHLGQKLATPIPYQFLPLQDCIDLSVLLISTTISLQAFTLGTRGVGGAVDVAVITPRGYEALKEKTLSADRFTEPRR